MRYKPHPYQAYAISRVISDPFVALFLEPSLGKTVITLTAIQELKFHRWAVSRPLVVAPKKVAEATWASEAAKWDHLQGMKVIPILGTEKQRINALYASGDVWVVNRENVPWLVDYEEMERACSLVAAVRFLTTSSKKASKAEAFDAFILQKLCACEKVYADTHNNNKIYERDDGSNKQVSA